jgi:hypothetical protein
MGLSNALRRQSLSVNQAVGSALHLGGLLLLACLLGACGGSPASQPTSTPTPLPTPTPTPLPTPAPTPELQLLFSDDFESGVLSSEWISGAGCEEHAGPGTPVPPAIDVDTIEIVDGRVWARRNCNFIQTTRRFLPPLRIEAEVGIDPSGRWPCWDHYFEFYNGQEHGPAGVLLFNFEDRDAIGLGPNCARDYWLPAAGPDQGVATLTVDLTSVIFAFVNTDQRRLVTPPGAVSLSASESRPVRLWLAGSSVDNVRIYGLP